MSRTDRDGETVTDTAVIDSRAGIATGIWRGALELLGPDGEFWVQGAWRRDDLPGPVLRCVAQACREAPRGGEDEHYERAIRELSMAVDPLYACPGHCRRGDGRCLGCAENILTGWNDSSDFARIRSGLERAIGRKEHRGASAALDAA